jgi:hypothetical protein
MGLDSRKRLCCARVPLLLALVCASILPAASTQASDSASAHRATPPAPQATARGCLPTHDGYLRARVRGARQLNLDWHDAELQCDGGPRPGHGFRLMFASLPGSAATPLRLVFGIDALARPGESREVPVNVTLIFERDHRIYSTGGNAQCTLDRLRVQALPKSTGSDVLRVSARGFCVGPASALGARVAGDEDQLVMSRFDFAGALHVDGT